MKCCIIASCIVELQVLQQFAEISNVVAAMHQAMPSMQHCTSQPVHLTTAVLRRACTCVTHAMASCCSSMHALLSYAAVHACHAYMKILSWMLVADV